MSTTRRRRIRANNERLRTLDTHRGHTATAQLERIQRFDEALAKVMAWIAIAVVVLIAIAVLAT